MGTGSVSTTQSYTITARKAINQPGKSLAIASFKPTADAYLQVGITGTAAGNVSYSLSAFPFYIATPNPNLHPELGDGTNQFVYDAQQPDGFLALPALVNVSGALMEDTTWMLPHVALSVSPAISPDALPSTWTSAAGVLYPLTVGNYPNGNAFPAMSYIYKGLPAQNTVFGDHQMTMKVEGNQSQAANFQTFFPAMGAITRMHLRTPLKTGSRLQTGTSTTILFIRQRDCTSPAVELILTSPRPPTSFTSRIRPMARLAVLTSTL